MRGFAKPLIPLNGCKGTHFLRILQIFSIKNVFCRCFVDIFLCAFSFRKLTDGGNKGIVFVG